MENKTLLDYWLILYRRRWLIGLIMLAAMVVSGLISIKLTPIYESRAIFFVPENPDIVSFSNLASSQGLIKLPALPKIAESPHSPYIGILKSNAIKKLVQEEYPGKTMGDLKWDVDFSLSDSYMLNIYARDADPETAAGVANAYIKNFNHLLDQYSMASIGENQTFIEEQINGIQERLSEARHRQHEFQKANNVVDIGRYKQNLLEKSLEYHQKIIATNVSHQEIQTKINAVKTEMEKEADLYKSTELIVGSPLILKLRQELSDLELQMASLKSELRDSHPDVVSLKNRYQQTIENLNIEFERISKSQIKHQDSSYEYLRRQLINLLVDKEIITAVLKTYSALSAEVDEELLLIPQLLAEFDTLTMETEKYRNILINLNMKLEEITMQTIREPRQAIVVEGAVPSPKPSFPVLWLNVLVAGLLGWAGGCFYAFFVEYLEGTERQRIFNLLKAIEATEKDV